MNSLMMPSLCPLGGCPITIADDFSDIDIMPHWGPGVLLDLRQLKPGSSAIELDEIDFAKWHGTFAINTKSIVYEGNF